MRLWRGRGPHAGRTRPARSILAGAMLLAVGFTLGISFGRTSATFATAKQVGANTFTTKRIFPGTRTTTAFDLRDASSGAETNASNPLAATGDSLTYTTGAWASTFSSTRYFDINANAPLPTAETIFSPMFNFTFASSGAATTCFYFEVRTSSSNTLLGTHGSSASPIGCAMSTATVGFSTAIPEVATTDTADNLSIRVYEKNSASSTSVIDAGTVGGSTPYASFTLSPTSMTDASTGTPASVAWSIATADTTWYAIASGWDTTSNTSKYLKFTFPAYVPSGANVTAATFVVSYRSNTSGNQTCYYIQVFNGSTLLATHGSDASPISCNSTTSFVTDSVSLPEVSSVAAANNTVVKVFGKNNGGNPGQRKSVYDVATLTLNYNLP
jgi:hypothetical protein